MSIIFRLIVQPYRSNDDQAYPMTTHHRRSRPGMRSWGHKVITTYLEPHQLCAVEEGAVELPAGAAEARVSRLGLHRAAAAEALLAIPADMLTHRITEGEESDAYAVKRMCIKNTHTHTTHSPNLRPVVNQKIPKQIYFICIALYTQHNSWTKVFYSAHRGKQKKETDTIEEKKDQSDDY